MSDLETRLAEWVKEEGLDRPARRTRGLPPRRQPSLSDKLAAVLLLLRRSDGKPLIPEIVRKAGKEAILAHVRWDHIIARALQGADRFDNYQPLEVIEHVLKTRSDMSRVRRQDNITKAQEEARRRLLARTLPEDRAPLPGDRNGRQRSNLGRSRPMPGSKASGYRHRMNGTWERRGS